MGAAPPCTPPCSRCSPGAPPRLRSRCATHRPAARSGSLRSPSLRLGLLPAPASPPLLHTAPRDPGPLTGPTRAAWALASTRAHTRYCVRRCGRGLRPSALSARFLRRARPALGPLRRAPCVPRPVPRAPPAPRFAAPVRRLAPSALFGPRRGRASLAAPPLPRSGARRAGALPRPLAGPVCLWARPCCAAGARRLALVALASRGLGPCAARGPAGGLLRAPSGFGPGGLPPPPPVAGWRPPFFAWGAGAFWLRARACPRLPSGSWCAAAAAALLGLAWLLWLCFALAGARHRCSPRRAASGSRVGFSPAPLPSPPPPLGAPGERGASGSGAPAPRLRRSPPCPAASGRLIRLRRSKRPQSSTFLRTRVHICPASEWYPSTSIHISPIPPLCHYPQRLKAALRRALSRPALTRCAVAPQAGLTFRLGCDTLVRRSPFRSFGGCFSLGHPWTAEKRSTLAGWALFLCALARLCPGFFRAQISRR